MSGGAARPSRDVHIAAPPSREGVRIAVNGYAWLSAPVRGAITGDVSKWGRYDSPGQTYYVAGDGSTAFSEVLSALKRRLGERDPLEADAAFLGITLDELVDQLAPYWDEEEMLGHDVVPTSWRARRRRLRVRVLDGSSWVAVEHPDSISTLEHEMESDLAALGVKQLTTGVLRGDDRAVTVPIGAHLRVRQSEQGILFGSKHGGFWCVAAWLGDRSEGVVVEATEQIDPSDPDLILAATRFGLRIL